jgi:hypothetical protein
VKTPVKRTDSLRLRDFRVECIGMITRHYDKRELKKFEDRLSEKSTLPIKFEKVSDVSSVKLKAGHGHVVSPSVSFFSSGGKGIVSIGSVLEVASRGWAHRLCLFGRLQSSWAAYSFWKFGQVGEGMVCVAGRRLCRWLDTRVLLCRSLQSRWGA